MKILFRDEKYKSETIEILLQLAKDAELSGKPEVLYYSFLIVTNHERITQAIVGDQLTCKNIRGAKKWRASDLTDLD